MTASGLGDGFFLWTIVCQRQGAPGQELGYEATALMFSSAKSERLGKTRTWWHLLLEQRMDQRLTQQYR
jgi:hypothetical protein